jgi:hypothetical protein
MTIDFLFEYLLEQSRSFSLFKETNDYIIYKINSIESFNQISKNTNWVGYINSDKLSTYIDKEIIFVFVDKKSNEKFLLISGRGMAINKDGKETPIPQEIAPILPGKEYLYYKISTLSSLNKLAPNQKWYKDEKDLKSAQNFGNIIIVKDEDTEEVFLVDPVSDELVDVNGNRMDLPKELLKIASR